MKNRIERTLIWFENEDERLYKKSDDFFGISTLLNRLINEKYEGRKIQFINLFFKSKERFIKFPIIPPNYIHYYGNAGGHLAYYGLIDFEVFDKLSDDEQKIYIWQMAYEYLQASAKQIKNDSLLEASEYAYKRGLEINLNPDYRVVETDGIVYGQPIKAAVWITFRKEGMLSKLTVEKAGTIIFEKQIDETVNGVELFLEMYKKIEIDNNSIIIRGSRDVEYLPLKLTIERDIIPFSLVCHESKKSNI